ncbi:hypothetical protein SS50377_21975 [Spironucleus salmonicida]|uniref:Uncharacterized protein n=1 Tax=Spironucleus salmonicida TaxID=348837 RepID=V6LRX7_9EUKA|nr:hypothetical protein SS50377_21975 [Spironucleus salmonicida]|eukprot:EST47013.1 Hypothetical protein SS50377_12969 [Spironucleus salmonicida]
MRMNSPELTNKRYISPSGLRARTPAVKYDQRRDRLKFEYNIVPGPNFYVKEHQDVQTVKSPTLNQSQRVSEFLKSTSQLPHLLEIETLDSFKQVNSHKRIPVSLPNSLRSSNGNSYIKCDKQIKTSPFSYSPLKQQLQKTKIMGCDRFKAEKINYYDQDRGPVGYTYFNKIQ